MKHISKISTYEKEMLSAMYASLDFMKCNELATADIRKAIAFIESKYTEEQPFTISAPVGDGEVELFKVYPMGSLEEFEAGVALIEAPEDVQILVKMGTLVLAG